jgi:hypothetical protein
LREERRGSCKEFRERRGEWLKKLVKKLVKGREREEEGRVGRVK